MLMKQYTLTIALTSIILWSCNSETKQSTATDSLKNIITTQKDTAAITDTHNAKNSLDWNGTYKGTTPCADCEGIETEITLNKDLTYSIKTKYLDKAPKVFEEKGKFTWDTTGSKIVMENVKDRPSQFFVGENTLTMLDMDGNKITGDLASKYILKK